MRIKSPVFVGRRDELARLARWLEEAGRGSPRVVIVGGEAGIGKSRLVSELARLAEAQGLRVLAGAAADYGEGGLPFGPVFEALRPLQAERGASLSSLFAVAPESRDLERASLPELRLSVPQHRVFDGLLDLLERSTESQRMLLVLEDLHWADASTREFLAFLARNLGSMRILVLGTYRADDVPRDHPLRRYLAELERAGRIERLTLPRFSRQEVGEQLTAISGQAVSDGLVGRLYERSGGNPFFSEEVFAAEKLGTNLPPDLKEILLTRVEELPEETRTVLSAAAVAGRADDQFLAEVTSMSPAAITESLRRAIDGFVLESTTQPDDFGYAFRHALLREAIYDDLLAGERVRLHQRVAEAMTANLGGDGGASADAQLLAQLAHHWERGRRPHEALAASWRAAEAAERAMAYPEAALHFERVLGLWPQLADPAALLRAEIERTGLDAPADRAYVFQRAAEAAATAGELKRSARHLRAAAELVDPVKDSDRAILIQLSLADDLNDAGDGLGANEAQARAQAALNATSSPAVRARVLLNDAGLRGIAGRADVALARAREALEAAQQAGDEGLQAECRMTIGSSLAFLGRLDEGLRYYEQARAVALGAGLEGLAAAVDKWRGVILDAAARFDEAIRTLEASQAVGRRLGLSRLVRHTDAVIAQSMHRCGRWQQAAIAAERSLMRPAAEWGRVVAAYLYVGLGRFEDAVRELELGWPSVDVSQSSASYGPYYAARAELKLRQGDFRAALSAAHDGIRLVQDMNDLRWIGDLGMLGLRAAAELGEEGLRQVEQLAAEVLSAIEEDLKAGTIFAGEDRAAALSVQAELGRARGASTPSAWAAAASSWLELGEPYPGAYALYRQAEASLVAGERAEAVEPLTRAAEIARGLGAEPLRREVEALAGRARVEIAKPQERVATEDRTADSYGLTAREREVLAMLAAGSTDQQIAEALFISPKTASVHVSNIKGKLGVEHRIEAAAIGLSMGLTAGPAAAKLRHVEEIGR